jgi:type I restriction enzyme, S subunit
VSMGLENSMPEGWVKTTLDEICEKMYSGGTPSTKRDDFYGGNIPWIRTQEVNFNYIFDAEIKITELGFKNSSAKYIPKNTVIVAMYGNSAGRVAFSKIEATTNQACCNFIYDKHKCDPSFVYFNLLGRYKEIEGKANGAAQQNLSVGVLKELSINIPALQEQKAIAKVLTAFDDKIELLQAQNKTLETMAQTIFKEWFGKYQIGDELPEGWREYELGDVCNLSAGGDKPKNSTSKSEGENIIPIYSNGIKNEGLYGFTNNASIFDESVTVSARGTIGYVCLRPIPYVPIVRLVSVLPDKNYLSAKFLFYFLKNNQILGTGTTQQQLTIPDFKLTRIIIPNSRLMDDFTKLINTFYIKIYSCKDQIQSLTKTRDTLLPKLMSGQVRVKNLKQTADA